jgi:hypothetical protein
VALSEAFSSAVSNPGLGTFFKSQPKLMIDPNGNLQWTITDLVSCISRQSEVVITKLSESESAIA